MSYVACKKKKIHLMFCKQLGCMRGPDIAVSFSVLVSMVYLLSTVTRVFFSHMTNVEPAFPLQPHSGVEVIQFLQRAS